MAETHTQCPSCSEPVPIRIGDTITHQLYDDTTGTVDSLHRDVKGGKPGLTWTTDDGDTHWAYLVDIDSVNGQPTDYAQRYPWTELPELPEQKVLDTLPAHEQVGLILAETHGLAATLKRLPVPDAFDPAEELDRSDGDLVGLDVQMSLRMYVEPEILNDPVALGEAFEKWMAATFPGGGEGKPAGQLRLAE